MANIREATLGDLTYVTVLFDKYRIFYEKKADTEKAEAFIKERLHYNDSKIFVAENKTKNLVGFIQLYPIFSSTKMKRLWLLNDLFIEKEHRGKGISKQLIERSKELCKTTNACGLILETAKTNSIGNILYPKVGFSLDKEHNYYTWESN